MIYTHFNEFSLNQAVLALKLSRRQVLAILREDKMPSEDPVGASPPVE